jgi:hypothetical protein
MTDVDLNFLARRKISHVGSSRSFWASILIFVALLFSSQFALAQFTQQGLAAA